MPQNSTKPHRNKNQILHFLYFHSNHHQTPNFPSHWHSLCIFNIFLPPPLSNIKFPIKWWPNHWESPYIYIPNPPFHTSHPPLIPPSQPFKISLPTQLHHYTSPKNILGSLKSLPRQISIFSTLQTNITSQKSIPTISFNATLIYPTPHFDTPYFVFWDGGWSTKVP